MILNEYNVLSHPKSAFADGIINKHDKYVD